MLHNIMSMIVYQAQRYLVNPDAPVLFTHQDRTGEIWQIVVARVPKQEVMAA